MALISLCTVFAAQLIAAAPLLASLAASAALAFIMFSASRLAPSAAFGLLNGSSFKAGEYAWTVLGGNVYANKGEYVLCVVPSNPPRLIGRAVLAVEDVPSTYVDLGVDEYRRRAKSFSDLLVGGCKLLLVKEPLDVEGLMLEVESSMAEHDPALLDQMREALSANPYTYRFYVEVSEEEVGGAGEAADEARLKARLAAKVESLRARLNELGLVCRLLSGGELEAVYASKLASSSGVKLEKPKCALEALKHLQLSLALSLASLGFSLYALTVSPLAVLPSAALSGGLCAYVYALLKEVASRFLKSLKGAKSLIGSEAEEAYASWISKTLAPSYRLARLKGLDAVVEESTSLTGYAYVSASRIPFTELPYSDEDLKARTNEFAKLLTGERASFSFMLVKPEKDLTEYVVRVRRRRERAYRRYVSGDSLAERDKAGKLDAFVERIEGVMQEKPQLAIILFEVRAEAKDLKGLENALRATCTGIAKRLRYMGLEPVQLKGMDALKAYATFRGA